MLDGLGLGLVESFGMILVCVPMMDASYALQKRDLRYSSVDSVDQCGSEWMNDPGRESIPHKQLQVPN